MAEACWWVLDSTHNMCERCWRWWSRGDDRAAQFAGAGPGAGGADLAGGGSDRHALWIWPAGGTRESGDRRGSAEWTFVCIPLAARGSLEDFGMGARRIRAVVQAAGSGGVQAAADERRGALDRVAGQRIGDDPGRDRCVEAEARATL